MIELDEALPHDPKSHFILRPRDDERRRGLRVWIVAVDGRDVGIVGDTLPWRGHRFGALQWWAALRDTSDWSVAATWSTGDQNVRTRTAAVTTLLDQLAR